MLDPTLQDGKKFPKWKPRLRTGKFLGFSNRHLSTIGLICNLTTDYISSQYHVVFDESFTTVSSQPSSPTLVMDQWDELFHFARDNFLADHDAASDGPVLLLQKNGLMMKTNLNVSAIMLILVKTCKNMPIGTQRMTMIAMVIRFIPIQTI